MEHIQVFVGLVKNGIIVYQMIMDIVRIVIRMIEFSLFFNRLCQSCCQFGLIGWMKQNKLVCEYCNETRYGKFSNVSYLRQSKGKSYGVRAN